MKAFYLSLLVVFLSSFSSSVALAQDAGESQSHFGVYEAITMNRSVVNDLKIDKEGNVFLQLVPGHKEKEIVVKISNERFSGYRTWWHGELELVSPANAGKAANGWTDRVQTQSNYVEYWMDGVVFLHLKRLDRDL